MDKIIIPVLKPFIYLYDYMFKYYSPDSLILSASFGYEAKQAGIRVFYLKLRNWKVFKQFFMSFSAFKLLFMGLQFSLIYCLATVFIM